MNKEDLIKKYEGLEGVWNANGAEIARQCFLRDLEQLNEIDTKKVTVPQFVADWIEHTKKDNYHIFGAIQATESDDMLDDWMWCDDNMEIFARAWLDGYEVEKEKRYLVKMKNLRALFCYLAYIPDEGYWTFMASGGESIVIKHTCKELEEAGFGWVFDCEGIEFVEVEE